MVTAGLWSRIELFSEEDCPTSRAFAVLIVMQRRNAGLGIASRMVCHGILENFGRSACRASALLNRLFLELSIDGAIWCAQNPAEISASL